MDDREQLLLVHGVTGLGRQHLLREEGDRLQTLALILRENGSSGKSGGIGMHDER